MEIVQYLYQDPAKVQRINLAMDRLHAYWIRTGKTNHRVSSKWMSLFDQLVRRPERANGPDMRESYIDVVREGKL